MTSHGDNGDQQMLKVGNSQPSTLHPAKMAFKFEGKISTVSLKQKL